MLPAEGMMQGTARTHQLTLLGPFGLFQPNGGRIEIPSKKGMALVALLAMARDGMRARSWLQDMLWGSRAPEQASASLRRELSALRRLLNAGPDPLLICEHGRVVLALDHIEVDAGSPRPGRCGEFLEGLDLADAEEFEQWLREQRSGFADRQTRPPAPALPSDIVDMTKPAAGLPDRPVLAVLPFANLTGNAGLDYVTEGLAGDLIDQIAHLRWLPVIAGVASAAYPSARLTLAEIGRSLGARYLIDGRLRGGIGALMLAIGISDADTGEAIWSHHIPLPADASATLLGPVLDEIVGTLSTRIDLAEMARASRAPATSSDVTRLIWRARWHHNRYTPTNARIAEDLLQQALLIDPDSSEAIIQLAYFRQRQLWIKRASAAEIADLSQLARRAINADPIDGRAYMLAGMAELWRCNTAPAVALLEQAIRLNPSLALAYTQLAAALYLDDAPDRALEPISRAFRLGLGEQYTYYALGELAVIRAMLGDHSGAIEAADHAIVRREAYWYAHVVKVHALVECGRADEAGAALRRLMQAKPRFDTSYIDWIPFVTAKWPSRLRASLGAAGQHAP
jgi:TolB-like protein/tetratricopeptide (TPR) repeat protein